MTDYLSAIKEHKAVILASVASSLTTVTIAFIIFAAWFQETQMERYTASVDENRIHIENHDKRIEKITKDIDISANKLEIEIRRYIDSNYGELSKRDENVAKLIFLYNQQDKRLSSIETILTKY